MSSSPKAGATPYVDFSFKGISNKNTLLRRAQYKAMLNGGFIMRLELYDPNSSMLTELIKNDYLGTARNSRLEMTYAFKWNKDGKPPEQATKKETAYVIGVRAWGKAPDTNYLEFIAIDPPSWYLNMGDAAGCAYKGRISDVVTQVVKKYAPEIGDPDISDTVDNDQNYWWMHRQDPKTFLNSLIDFSSSFTSSKTSWIVVPRDDDGKISLVFKEQAKIDSIQRGYYRHTTSDASLDTLIDWHITIDSSLSLSNTMIITNGLSAISGQYLDKRSDTGQKAVYVKDKTTDQKYIAKVDKDRSFAGPKEDPPPGSKTAGWTSVGSIPELYSAGDVGKPYSEYIDGRARDLYLKMTNMIFRAKFQVIGHGEWLGCGGLGTDTIFVRWEQSNDDSAQPYFLDGNWLVYGYEHNLTVKDWKTDIYCARFDYDAQGKQVGGK